MIGLVKSSCIKIYIMLIFFLLIFSSLNYSSIAEYDSLQNIILIRLDCPNIQVSDTGRWIWFLVTRILIHNIKKDTNSKNNSNWINDLVVGLLGESKPIISNVNVRPSDQEQGGAITITADVTDDSELSSVIISIENPNGVSVIEKYNMFRTTDDEFKYIFYNTFEIGKYTFEIEAIDTSIYRNNANWLGEFEIKSDKTDPVILYYDAELYVQMKNVDVNITCIASDNIGINTVEVKIKPPKGLSFEKKMNETSKDKYVYNNIYNISGKYNFTILVKDKAGNRVKTEPKYFWITSNIDDLDDDGVPDWWEGKYNLNPEDPSDADDDMDEDGYTNFEEFTIGTNPEKDIFLENVAYRIKNKIWYLALSIVLFLIILIMAYTVRTRKNI